MQLYVEAPGLAEHAFRAVRELRGFCRVNLAAGESREVRIPLAEHAFDVFHGTDRDWRRVAGSYTIQAAASSRDIRAAATVEIVAGDRRARDAAASAPTTLSPHYVSGRVELASSDDFAGLLGRPLPSPDWPVGGRLTREHSIAQTRGRGGFAGLLYFAIDRSRAVLLALGRPLQANTTRYALEIPFRSVARMSNGLMTEPMLDGLLLMVNGEFFRGVRKLWSAWRAERAARRAHRNPTDG